MNNLLKLLASALLLTGCASSQPTLTTLGLKPEQGVPAVPCPSLHVILYHAPVSQADVTAWIAGKLPDPGNGYDTTQTVTQILQENAAIEAVCGKVP